MASSKKQFAKQVLLTIRIGVAQPTPYSGVEQARALLYIVNYVFELGGYFAFRLALSCNVNAPYKPSPLCRHKFKFNV